MGKRKTYFEQVPLAEVKKAVGLEIFRPHPDLACCAICNEPVELERCKTDEDGDAVHEDCYVSKVARPT
jgi:hypothetical protein